MELIKWKCFSIKDWDQPDDVIMVDLPPSFWLWYLQRENKPTYSILQCTWNANPNEECTNDKTKYQYYISINYYTKR